MKRLLLLILAITPLAGFPQSPAASPKLAGIIHVENLKLAIIQTSPPRSQELTFSEGQWDESIEVFTINPTNLSVTARVSTNAQRSVLALGSSTAGHIPGIVLEEVTLQTLLNLFSEFSERTILQHPLLPNIKFSLAMTATNRNEAARILQNALTEKRIAVVPDGSKFLLVAPKEMIPALKPHAPGSGTTNTNVGLGEVIPAGSINFTSAALANVLMIYAEILGGKLDLTGPPLRDGKVYFRMPKELTKEECLYVFETLVGWQGIKLVPTGTGLLKAVATD